MRSSLIKLALLANAALVVVTLSITAIAGIVGLAVVGDRQSALLVAGSILLGDNARQSSFSAQSVFTTRLPSRLWCLSHATAASLALTAGFDAPR